MLFSTEKLEEMSTFHNIIGLVTTTVLDTKIKEVGNNIPNVTDLIKETYYDAKMSDIEGKYFTTADYNRYMSNTLDAIIKQK